MAGKNKPYPTLEEGGGEEFLLSLIQGSPWKDEMATLRELVAEGYERFWNKDQICGFDEYGNRIGTGIPRVRPSYTNEYAL